MLKFFRQYNKIILTVGAVALLVMFLLAEFVSTMATQAGIGGATWATVGKEQRRLTNNDLAAVQNELRLITLLSPEHPARIYLEELGAMGNPEMWFLLSREAELAGLVGGASDAMELFPGVELQEIVNRFAGPTRAQPEFVLNTLAKVRGVTRLLERYLNAMTYSDRRLMTSASTMLLSTTADVMIVHADDPPFEYEPAEEEVLAHFEKYADISPDDPDHPFGYRFPDRLKIEWLTVKADSVRENIERSDQMSRRAQWQHYERHSDRFGALPEGAGLPDEVRRDLLSELTRAELEGIARFAAEELRRPRRGFPRFGGYYELPDDWAQRQVRLDELAERIQEHAGIRLPEYRAIGDRWLSVADVKELEPISRASTVQYGVDPLKLPDIVAVAKEFGGRETIPIQEGVAGPPLWDDDDNLYIFRIIDTEPSRPPHDADEIREQIVKDLRRLRHFEWLTEQASEIENRVVEEGLLSVGLDFRTAPNRETLALADPDLLDFSRQMNTALPRRATPLPEIGPHEPTLEQIILRARNLFVEYGSLANSPEEMRVVVLPVKEHLALVIARLESAWPATWETYEQDLTSGILPTMVRSEEFDDLFETLKEAFSLEALTKRHNFERRRVIEEDEALLQYELEESA